MKRLPVVLPCVPCPHGSICCAHGVGLDDAEASAIARRWGADKLVVRDGETRTQLIGGKCVFAAAGGGCSIHAEPEYPSTCRLFPWRDSDHPELPYPYDLEICPELTNDMDRSLADRLPTAPRLRFRRWTEGDLADAMELWGDPRVTAFIDARPALTPADVEERLRRELEHDAQSGVQYWPVLTREDGALVGCAGLRPRDATARVYELGFHLRPHAWGRGLATEAARASVRFAFEELGATALFAGHHPANVASRRVLEKLGFRQTHEELYPPTGLVHPAHWLARTEWRDP